MDISKILGGTSKEKNEDENILNEISKKINLKSFKDGNKMKTQITGIDGFIHESDKKSQEENIEKFVKDIRKKLGCSGTISKDDNNKTVIIFSGDQITSLRHFLTEKGIEEEFIRS
jgi:translation initiation factor 1 (eIF-1/SUI1)